LSASGDLDRAIRTALRALEAAPDGRLELSERRRLRGLFGPWTPPYDPGGPDAGLLRRAALLVDCVRRAYPVWARRFPADRRPLEIAGAVMPALRGEVPEERVDGVARALREDVEPLGVLMDESSAFFAGMAAYRLTIDAWDGDLDEEFHPPDMRDHELDEWQVEFLAELALAGEDPEARRVYWRWYVSEAFPAAYASAGP
jgi:Immunity protein Imm5